MVSDEKHQTLGRESFHDPKSARIGLRLEPVMNDLPATDAEIRAAILDLLMAAGPGKTVSPADAARLLAGKDEKRWSRLMQPVRRVAVAMARSREIEIRRKGKPVDHEDFRGVYRLALVNPTGSVASTQPGGAPIQ